MWLHLPSGVSMGGIGKLVGHRPYQLKIMSLSPQTVFKSKILKSLLIIMLLVFVSHFFHRWFLTS